MAKAEVASHPKPANPPRLTALAEVRFFLFRPRSSPWYNRSSFFGDEAGNRELLKGTKVERLSRFWNVEDGCLSELLELRTRPRLSPPVVSAELSRLHYMMGAVHMEASSICWYCYRANSIDSELKKIICSIRSQ